MEVLKARVSYEFDVKHAGSKQAQKIGEFVGAMGTDRYTYEAALAWCMDAEEESADNFF